MNKQFSKLLAAFVVTFSLAQTANADILTALGLFYQSYSDKSGDSSSTTTETFLNFRLGSVMSSGFYWGGIYHTENTAYTGSSRARTSLGGSVGYVGSDAGIMAHYFLSSEYDNGSTVEKGTGIGIDAYYVWGLSSNIDFGPMLSWKSFSYTEDASGDLANTHTMGGIDPYFLFLIRF